MCRDSRSHTNRRSVLKSVGILTGSSVISSQAVLASGTPPEATPGWTNERPVTVSNNSTSHGPVQLVFSKDGKEQHRRVVDTAGLRSPVDNDQIPSFAKINELPLKNEEAYSLTVHYQGVSETLAEKITGLEIMLGLSISIEITDEKGVAIETIYSCE